MSNITVYPRHFTSRHHSGEGIALSKGDLRVNLCFKAISGRQKPNTWDFMTLVTETAMRLFGDLDTWIGEQTSNPHLTGYNREFIQDTIQFIQTGERQMSPLTWLGLMNEVEDKIAAREFTAMAPESLGRSSASSTPPTLARWLAHPGGLEDLACSLFIFFGSSNESV